MYNFKNSCSVVPSKSSMVSLWFITCLVPGRWECLLMSSSNGYTSFRHTMGVGGGGWKKEGSRSYKKENIEPSLLWTKTSSECLLRPSSVSGKFQWSCLVYSYYILYRTHILWVIWIIMSCSVKILIVSSWDGSSLVSSQLSFKTVFMSRLKLIVFCQSKKCSLLLSIRCLASLRVLLRTHALMTSVSPAIHAP